MRISYFFLSLCAALCLNSCDPGNDPNIMPEPEKPVEPVEPSRYHILLSVNEWSAGEHKNAQIAEVHTNVGDFVMSTEDIPGYSLNMKKDSQKDENGYYVYRILADMDQVTDTTTTNNRDKINLRIKLTGTGNERGKTETVTRTFDAGISRVKVYKLSNEAIGKTWVLTEHSATNIYDSFVWDASSENYIARSHQTSAYDDNDSPLKFMNQMEFTETFNDTSGNTIKMVKITWLYKADGSLFGFPEGSFSITHSFRNGICYEQQNGRFGDSNDSPMIIWQSGNKMWCQADEYDDSGILKVHHTYKFEAKN